MGTDKSLLVIGTRRLGDLAVDALVGAGAHHVVLIGTAASHHVLGGDAHVGDRHPGQGPLGGVVTALADHAERLPGTGLVILPCDLPGVTADDVSAFVRAAATLAQAGRHDVVIARMGDDLVPPIGWWEPSVLDVCTAAFDDGARSMREALAALSVGEVAVGPGFADADDPGALGSSR